jgi:hypothetical protein
MVLKVVTGVSVDQGVRSLAALTVVSHHGTEPACRSIIVVL